MKRFVLYLFSLLFVFLISSCTSSGPLFERYTALDSYSLCRVAVLPFVNTSGFSQGELIFQRVFSSEMVRIAGAEVVSEGDVRGLVRELRIFPNKLPDIEQIKIIGSRLDATYVVSGRISRMEEVYGSKNINPGITVKIEVYDGPSGRVLWSTYYSRKGEDYRTVMHFGMVNTVTELSRIMAAEIVEKWFEQGVKRCGE